MITSEKKVDNNYSDFDMTKMEQILKINYRLKSIDNIFVLKDD